MGDSVNATKRKKSKSGLHNQTTRSPRPDTGVGSKERLAAAAGEARGSALVAALFSNVDADKTTGKITGKTTGKATKRARRRRRGIAIDTCRNGDESSDHHGESDDVTGLRNSRGRLENNFVSDKRAAGSRWSGHDGKARRDGSTNDSLTSVVERNPSLGKSRSTKCRVIIDEAASDARRFDRLTAAEVAHQKPPYVIADRRSVAESLSSITDASFSGNVRGCDTSNLPLKVPIDDNVGDS